MLVLTRFEGESITIGDDVEVMVLDVRKGDKRVRLGIAAPKGIPVHRKEIQLKINREKGVTNGVVTNLPSKTH